MYQDPNLRETVPHFPRPTLGFSIQLFLPFLPLFSLGFEREHILDELGRDIRSLWNDFEAYQQEAWLVLPATSQKSQATLSYVDYPGRQPSWHMETWRV
jgi:hypothetical protein